MKLVERPVRSIVRALADAAARWKDADFPPRVRALAAVCGRTGYSEPVVEYAFDRLFSALTQTALETAIVAELGCLDVLDRFVERGPTSRVRALPVGRVCIVSSRTTVGVAIVPALFALCAKCDVLVKDREDALVASFFATLAQELDDLGEAAAANAWHGTSTADEFDHCAAVVVFGNDSTVSDVRARLPAAARLIPYGSKISCGYVARDALALARARDVAGGAARDLVLYDTEGCLSLRLLFVERGGAVSPPEFAAMLGPAVERAAVEFPAGTRDAGVAARVAAVRDLAAFRSAGGMGAVFSDRTASYVAVLDPPQSEPPSFLPRTLIVHAVDAPEEAVRFVERHRLPVEAVAIAGMRADVTAAAVRMGAARIAPFGALQSPPVGGYHGGRPRIAEFVRWVTDET